MPAKCNIQHWSHGPGEGVCFWTEEAAFGGVYIGEGIRQTPQASKHASSYTDITEYGQQVSDMHPTGFSKWKEKAKIMIF